MLVRDRAKGERVREDIVASTGSEDVHVELCDLSSLASVREFAAGFAERHGDLHVLVNNAGVMPQERSHTEEGFELTFATNVLGPYLLTDLLLPLLRAGAPSRVINVSSGGMYTEGLDAGDLQLERREYDPPAFYAHTKRCEVLLTELWDERLAGSGVSFHSMHPGWADTPGVETSLPTFRRVLRPVLRNAAEGADTVVWLAGAAEPAHRTGSFWHDRVARPTHRLPRTRAGDADRERLWQQCRALAGLAASLRILRGLRRSEGGRLSRGPIRDIRQQQTAPRGGVRLPRRLQLRPRVGPELRPCRAALRGPRPRSRVPRRRQVRRPRDRAHLPHDRVHPPRPRRARR